MSSDSSLGSDEEDILLENSLDKNVELNYETEPEFYYGKPNRRKNEPGFQWRSSEPNQNVRVPAHNIVRG